MMILTITETDMAICQGYLADWKAIGVTFSLAYHDRVVLQRSGCEDDAKINADIELHHPSILQALLVADPCIGLMH
jgi:hypothetical protein